MSIRDPYEIENEQRVQQTAELRALAFAHYARGMMFLCLGVAVLAWAIR